MSLKILGVALLATGLSCSQTTPYRDNRVEVPDGKTNVYKPNEKIEIYKHISTTSIDFNGKRVFMGAWALELRDPPKKDDKKDE